MHNSSLWMSIFDDYDVISMLISLKTIFITQISMIHDMSDKLTGNGALWPKIASIFQTAWGTLAILYEYIG
jgi:hypothetical protein